MAGAIGRRSTPISSQPRQKAYFIYGGHDQLSVRVEIAIHFNKSPANSGKASCKHRMQRSEIIRKAEVTNIPNLLNVVGLSAFQHIFNRTPIVVLGPAFYLAPSNALPHSFNIKLR